MDKFDHAPLFFAVGQMRYNPVLSFESYVPALQERLRKIGYPDLQQLVQMHFDVRAAGGNQQDPLPASLPAQRSVSIGFANAEKTAGFLLDAQSLSFMTTAYDTFEKFVQEFRCGLEITNEALGGLAFVERIGLRYLNAIVPRAGESTFQYLEKPMLGLPAVVLNRVPSAKFEISFAETRLHDQEQSATARVFIYNRNLTWPPDLFVQDLLTVADEFSALDGEHAMLDTDAFTRKRTTFDIDQAFVELDKLHNLVEQVFHATITDHARRVWSGKENPS